MLQAESEMLQAGTRQPPTNNIKNILQFVPSWFIIKRVHSILVFFQVLSCFPLIGKFSLFMML